MLCDLVDAYCRLGNQLGGGCKVLPVLATELVTVTLLDSPVIAHCKRANNGQACDRDKLLGSR